MALARRLYENMVDGPVDLAKRPLTPRQLELAEWLGRYQAERAALRERCTITYQVIARAMGISEGLVKKMVAELIPRFPNDFGADPGFRIGLWWNHRAWLDEHREVLDRLEPVKA